MFTVCAPFPASPEAPENGKERARDRGRKADANGETGTTCKLDSSKTSTSSPWICAWNQGSALNSASTSATIAQHGANSMRQFTFDLTSAVLSTDSNPFVSSTSSTGTGTASGSSPTSTGESGGDGSSGDSGSSGNSGATVVGPSFKVITDYETAHGVIMGATMVLFLPLGAVFMRLGASVYLHGAWQIFALWAMLCGFGLGIKLAQMRNLVSTVPFSGGSGGTNPFPFSPGGGPGFPFSTVERRAEIRRASITLHCPPPSCFYFFHAFGNRIINQVHSSTTHHTPSSAPSSSASSSCSPSSASCTTCNTAKHRPAPRSPSYTSGMAAR